MPGTIKVWGDCRVKWHDLVAGVVAISATITLCILAVIEVDVSPPLGMVIGASIGWLFRGAEQKTLNGNGAPL